MTGRATRTAQALIAMVLIAAVAGCARSESESPSRPTMPTSSSTPNPPQSSLSPKARLRERLIAGLRVSDSPRARLVDKAELTVVPTDWLTGWQIVDVLNSTLAHPQRFYLALSADGSVVNLTGQPESFNRVISDARPRVVSAAVATDLAATFLDSTRDFVKYSYRIDGVDDIKWLPQLDGEAKQVRSRVEQAYGSKVTRPRADQVEGAWRFTIWMVNGNRLVRHDLQVAGGGVLSDTPQTVFEGLPVPDSI
jgi:hypothetical protein